VDILRPLLQDELTAIWFYIMRNPIVLVPACVRQIGAHANHTVQFKYVDAVVRGAGCVPLILPALGEATDLESVMKACDGIMLTGSPSNVHPSHYAQDVLDPALPQDALRDATTLPLIRAAIKRGIPLIAVCRGFQEMNVALGGSLYQAVQEVPGMMDHREKKGAALDEQYAPAHSITISTGGKLAAILEGAREIQVNSLHGQGIRELAKSLVVEATAPDGLVEAFTVSDAAGFTLGVQWHPEWQITSNPDSMKMFRAFGQACRAYQAKQKH
jgi:putative glutamine amidotransferase